METDRFSLVVRDYRVQCIATPAEGGIWQAHVVLEQDAEPLHAGSLEQILPAPFHNPKDAVIAAIDLAHRLVYERSLGIYR